MIRVNLYNQFDLCAMFKNDRTLMTQIELIFTGSISQLNKYESKMFFVLRIFYICQMMNRKSATYYYYYFNRITLCR